MRPLVGALGLLAAAGVAHADDAYTLPPVGAELTYRLVTTSKILDKSISVTAGQIYTYRIVAAHDGTLEASIKPVAMIYGCPESGAPKGCAFAAKAAGATRDGDLVTVPIPDPVGEALAKQSSFKGRYFFNEDRKFPLPGQKNPDDPDDAEFGEEPAMVLTSSLICDYEEVKQFLPLGTAPKLSLPCQSTVSSSQSRVGKLPAHSTEEALTVEVVADGPGRLTLPSGDWAVQKVSMKFVPKQSSQSTADAELQVASELGISVKTHSSVASAATHLSTESDSEMIAYKP